VAFNHRSSENSSKLPEVRDDITAAISFVRENSLGLPIDTNRLNLWYFSGSGVHLPAAMGNGIPCIRSVVAYYPVLEPPPFFQSATREKFSALAQLKIHAPNIPPLLLVKAGKDYADWHEHIDQFRAEAERLKVRLEFLEHPTGRHAFDLFNNDEISKDIIQRTWQFLRQASEPTAAAKP
jgi:dienelactone hydrolase